MENVCTLFLLFILYSFIGWCMEVCVVFFNTKKLVNRGFLIGPLCPIYGWGSILIIILLNKYENDYIALFVMAMLLCSILEYFTSYVMEKLFKARWWDYSDKRFHINGRVCLDNAIAFGVLGIFVLKIVNPFLLKVIGILPSIGLYIVSGIIFVIYLVDNIVSLKVITGFKNVAKSINKDSTEEITKKVREVLSKRGGLYKRLVKAFDFEASRALLKDIQEKVTTGAKKAKETVEEVFSRLEDVPEELKKRIIDEYMKQQEEKKKKDKK